MHYSVKGKSYIINSRADQTVSSNKNGCNSMILSSGEGGWQCGPITDPYICINAKCETYPEIRHSFRDGKVTGCLFIYQLYCGNIRGDWVQESHPLSSQLRRVSHNQKQSIHLSNTQLMQLLQDAARLSNGDNQLKPRRKRRLAGNG